MDIGQGKVFYKPEAGTYLGTIIDVVEKPGVQTQYGLKNKVLILWVLSHLNGAPYLDPEGQPFQLAAYITASINEKSTQPLFRNLYQIIASILGGQPPLITNTAQLEQLLLGRSNVIMATKTPNPAKANDFFVNPVGILPLQAGQTPPQAPQGFIRSKDRPKTQAGPQGRPVQTYAQPQQPVYAAPAPPAYQAPTNNVSLNTQAPAPGTNEAF
jgi:hypothetical protein